MTPVTMPQVGENLTSGVVLEWMKAEGYVAYRLFSSTDASDVP